MSKVGNLLKADTPYYTITLPMSGLTVKYRPFRVKEEKILLLSLEDGSDNAVLIGVKNLLNECVAVDGEETFDAGTLPVVDMEYLFVNLRAKSISEVCSPSILCPHTGEKTNAKVDLTKIKPPKTDKVKESKIKLSDSVGITMKAPTINTLIENDIINYSSAKPEEIISLVSSCIDEIWTEDEVFDSTNLTKEDLNEFVESMSVKNFDDVGDYFESIPTLQHVVKYSVINPETKEKENHQITLRGLNDFFV